MKQEFNKRKPVEKGGKRIGKSLPSKTAGSGKRKQTGTKTEGSEKSFRKAEPKRIFKKPAKEGIKNIPKKSSATGEMRLNRFIANAGEWEGCNRTWCKSVANR